MDWSRSTVLVTGATGAVGTNLVPALLDRGARVVCLVLDHEPGGVLAHTGVLERCRVVSGRLEVRADLWRALTVHQVDTVFHLGAQSLVGPALESPVPTFEANIQGTWNLLEACRQSPRVERVVVASSDKAYGDVPAAELPYVETMPPQGRNPYDVSKSCADLLAQSYAHTYDVPVAIARCGNLYGPGDLNESRLVPKVIHELLQGRAPVLRSDGTFLRDFLYVDDVAQAYVLLAENVHRSDVKGQPFNFGTGVGIEVLDLAQRIAERMGLAHLAPRAPGKAPFEIHDQVLDATRARERLGWAPQVSLEDGLDRTIAWYRQWWGSAGPR